MVHSIFDAEQAVHFITASSPERDSVYYSGHRNGGLDWYLEDRKRSGDPRPREVRHLEQALDDEVVCLTAVGVEQEMRRLEAILKEACGDALTMHVWDDPYARNWWWLMVHDEAACKGRAVNYLRQRMPDGIHKVIAFGDEVNDLGLLHHADEGIAVSNACPELIQCAQKVIGHHAEDSVIAYLEGELAAYSPPGIC
jgi:hydroxymethylpyrimidine pyrophosphatase-like HAD family hydrolase